MAFIGEASAIVAVAQIGISLSNTLIAYVGEVHDAPFRVQRIGNEVLTTSERLKDIGELVEKNGQTHIFSEEGVLSAVRCSEECHKILEELRKVLSKGGWHQWMRGEEKVEIDISLFSTLRWPFIKTKLEVPRAELERIKVDLMLLFSSAMALGASSAVEKAKFRQDIPGLNRTRDLAARMAEQARRRALDRENGPQGRIIVKDGDWFEGDPEMLQEFADFQERRMQEEEDKRLAERAALLLAEKEEQKRKAEEERRLLEKEILEKYSKEQAEIQARNERRKEGLRDELKAVGLEPDKIEAILESSTFRHNDMEHQRSMPLFARPVSSSRDTSDDRDSTRSQIIKNKWGGRLIMNGIKNNWRLKLPWRKRKSRQSGSSSINSYHRSTSDRSNGGPVNTTMDSGSFEIEAWLVDVFSHERVMLWPSDEWFKNEWNKVEKRGSDVWRQFARLKPLWRTAILQFLNFKNPQEGGHWSLFSIELPQRSSRTRLFGHKSADQIIQLIVFNRKDISNDDDSLRANLKSATIDSPSIRPKPPERAFVTRGQAEEPSYNRTYADIQDEIRRLEAERNVLVSERNDAKGARGRSNMTEEIVIPRDSKNRPIEVVETSRIPTPPYEEEVIYRRDRDVYRRDRDASPPQHGGIASGIKWIYRRPESTVRFDEDQTGPEGPSSREKSRNGEDLVIRSYGHTAEGHIVGSDREQERWNDPSSPQQRQIIIRRSERENAQKKGKESWLPPIPEKFSTRVREISSSPEPSHGEISERERGQRRRSYTTDRLRSERLESADVNSSNQELALVRRRGGSRRVDDYIKDRVLDRSIRVRGEDYPSSSFGSYGGGKEHGHGHQKYSGRPNDTNYVIIKRWIPEAEQEILFEHSRKLREGKLLKDTTAELKKKRDRLFLVRKKSPYAKRSAMRYQARQDSYGERTRVPVRESRFRSQVDLDSEDEDDVGARYTEQKSSPEPELTDEELIARTLQRFTTFKPDATYAGPLVIPTDSTWTAPLRPSLETKKRHTGTSEAIAPPLSQATSEPSGQASYSTPAGISARTKQEKHGHTMSGDSLSPRPGEVTNHEISNMYVLGAGNILEEPAVITEEPVTSEWLKRQGKFADGAKSSKIVAARADGTELNTYSTTHRPRLEGRQSRSSYGRVSVDGRHPLSSDEHDAGSPNRGEAPSHPSELTRKELEIERLQRQLIAKKRGVAEQNQGEHDNSPAEMPNSRSATVEEFVPDAADRNGSYQKLSKAESLVQDEDRFDEAVWSGTER